MRVLRAFLIRLAGCVWKDRRDREFTDEMESHLQFHIDDNLRSGMTPAEARRNALIQLGGLGATQERYRDRRGLPSLESLMQDLRYASRALRRDPRFTAIAIATLALGIGANTAIFSVVDGVLLRPLAYPDPDRLVMIWESRANLTGTTNPGRHEYPVWKESSQSFRSMAAVTFADAQFTLTGAGEPVMLTGARVTSDFFPTLGIEPRIGRVFLAEEDQPGAGRVAVLSYRLWQSRYGSDPAVTGRTITLNDQIYTVAGVMPPDFNLPPSPLGGGGPDLWAPIAEPLRQFRGRHDIEVIARIKPGVSVRQAQAEIDAIARRIEREDPQGNTGHGALVVPLREHLVREVKTSLLVLLGAVGFVLLIACTNISHLLLTRTATRQREISIRAALGAGRLRIVRQLLTESILLSLIGGGLGLLLAEWTVRILPVLGLAHLPRLEEVHLHWTVLAANAALSILTGAIFGLVPAFQASRLASGEWLKTRAPLGRSQHHLRNLLVVSELALSLLLLIGAGLMLRSLQRLQGVDPGFRPQNLLTMDISLPGARYREAWQSAAFFSQLLGRIRAIPGVEAVGATSATPLSGAESNIGFSIEGRPDPPRGKEPSVGLRVVSADYFRTLGIPLLQGRFFQPSDARTAVPVIRWYPQQPMPAHSDEPQPQPVLIVNQTMARQFWPNESPIGKRVRVIFSPWLTIVGVAGNTHHSGLSLEPAPEIYFPDLQEPQRATGIVVRTRGDPTQLTAAVRARVAELDKQLPITNIRTMEQMVDASLAQPRWTSWLLGSFAVFSLLLAMIGVYGVISYSVAQITREIGIRMALGARQADVMRMVVGRGIALTVAGLLIGVLASLGMTRLLATLLYQIKPTDPVTFAEAGAILAVLALGACYVPARRAARIDPMMSLRNE